MAAEEGGFEITTDKSQVDSCDMILLCVGEIPYAEWFGDSNDLSLTGAQGLPQNASAIKFAKNPAFPQLLLSLQEETSSSDDYIDQWDSCIMLYLPGSEGGNAVADVLTGKVQMKGTLPMPYYSSVDQIGTGKCWKEVGWNAFKD